MLHFQARYSCNNVYLILAITDVVYQIKALAYAYDAQLTVEERNLLSVAYKNITNNLRNSWRVIDCLETLESSRPKPRRLLLIRHEKVRIEKELAEICSGIVKVNISWSRFARQLSWITDIERSASSKSKTRRGNSVLCQDVGPL